MTFYDVLLRVLLQEVFETLDAVVVRNERLHINFVIFIEFSQNESDSDAKSDDILSVHFHLF